MKLVHVKQRNHLVDPGKLLQERTGFITLQAKKDRFTTAADIANKIKDNLGVNVLRHTVSRRLK